MTEFTVGHSLMRFPDLNPHRELFDKQAGCPRAKYKHTTEGSICYRVHTRT